MTTYFLLSVVILAIACFRVFICAQETVELIPDYYFNSGLTYLGIVNRKAYFFEPNATRTWSAAGEVCRNASFELGQIKTSAEINFLKNALAKYSNSYLWTAEREPRTINIFVKNGTEISLDGKVFEGFKDEVKVYYCSVVKADMSVTIANECDIALYGTYALCQSESQ